MSKASPLGFKPQSFTETESYAYSYAKHSYAKHGYESGGFSGPPESPMLSVGINNARSDLVSGLLSSSLGKGGDIGGAAPRGGKGGKSLLPDMNKTEAVRRWAPDVQHALAEFELMSHLAFRCDDQDESVGATLYHLDFSPAGTGKPSGVAAKPIATLSRPTREFFEVQLKLVESWTSSRDTRDAEILTQIDPPMGYFASIANLHSERTPKTLRLIALAQHFAFMVGMQFKHALACPRPVEYSALIQPMIETPAHASLPAGHAIESFVAVGVIEKLVPGFGTVGKPPSQTLRRLAHRIARNRVVAGLHFPIDCVAGELLGTSLAEYFVAHCKAKPTWTARTFNGSALSPTDDGSKDHEADRKLAEQVGCAAPTTDEQGSEPNRFLQHLWEGAELEWTA